MAYYTEAELAGLGLASYGRNVRLSTKASLYNPSAISLGNDVRIDDFCVLSAGPGGVAIGSFIHVAVYSSLIGAGRITLEDYSNISSRVSVFSSNDDYSGEHLTNPTIPGIYTGISSAPVTIGRHAIVGSGSVVLPGVTIGEGAAIGALSLVKRDCEAFTIYAGNPLRRLRDRSRRILELENLHQSRVAAEACHSRTGRCP
jgi:acetyltransferase-like isoleucine patch superfamily enzyme